MKLKDQIAIVTGAGRGIGRGIALRLAREGAHVALTAMHMENVERVSQEIKEINPEGKGFPIQMDVSVEKDVEAMVERVLQEMGPIDILVNNAGTLAITPAVDISEEEWDRVLDVNLKGTFLCSKHVTREMLK